MKRATAPIMVHDEPTTKNNALDNILAFADEERGNQLPGVNAKLIQIPAFPRITRCDGWLDVDRQVILDIPRRDRPRAIRLLDIWRSLEPEKDYIAIVYEYIPEADNDIDVVDSVCRFFRLVGFCRTDKADRNWRGSVLVDHSDIVYPHASGWVASLYRSRRESDLV